MGLPAPGAWSKVFTTVAVVFGGQVAGAPLSSSSASFIVHPKRARSFLASTVVMDVLSHHFRLACGGCRVCAVFIGTETTNQEADFKGRSESWQIRAR